jgi:hypothetical protein
MFENEYTGLLDDSKNPIRNGDNLIIEVTENVHHKGIVIYEMGAFSLKFPRNETGLFEVIPLVNYAPYCKLLKTND